MKCRCLLFVWVSTGKGVCLDVDRFINTSNSNCHPTLRHQEDTYDVLLASCPPPIKLLPPSAVSISACLKSTWVCVRLTFERKSLDRHKGSKEVGDLRGQSGHWICQVDCPQNKVTNVWIEALGTFLFFHWGWKESCTFFLSEVSCKFL